MNDQNPIEQTQSSINHHDEIIVPPIELETIIKQTEINIANVNTVKKTISDPNKRTLEGLQNWVKYVNETWQDLIDACGFDQFLEKAAKVMLYGFYSQDPRPISRATGFDRSMIIGFCRAARKGGIWVEKRSLRAEWLTYAETGDFEGALLAFTLDTMVVGGVLECNNSRYRLTNKGKEVAKNLIGSMTN